MIGKCSDTFSAKKQSSFGINNLLCFILIVFPVARSIAVARAEIERGRSGAQFGLLEFLLEEMDSQADNMDGVIVA